MSEALSLERMRAALGLNDAEMDFAARAYVRSFDELHAYLLATPSLDRRPELRRRDLLARLEGGAFLSATYRAVLARPRASYLAGALLPDAARTPDPPPDWPGRGKPRDLRDQQESLDLIGAKRAAWPVREQGATPACVPFAANACLEFPALLTPAGVTRLSSTFLFQRVSSLPSGGTGQLGLKLGGVRQVLGAEGVCAEAIWSDNRPLDALPSPAAFQDAATRRGAPAYWDIGRWEKARVAQRWPGVARTILDALRARLPVAITIGQFRDPDEPANAPNNWGQPLAEMRGQVLERLDEWERVSGHAVCLYGFQPDPQEALGGWFLIRNSWGGRWATEMPDVNDKVPPVVPRRGYGAISARQIEECVTEILVCA